MDWNLLLNSYGSVILNPQILIMLLVGAVGGVLFGAIPGLTATLGVALLIPFSFGMDLIPSLGLLLGIYCGAMYGGSISAILIHTPGTPAAAATILDGYPMGQKGEAGRALSIAMFSSFCGGVIGALVMTFLSPVVARAALAFGPAELFMLAMFGLSVIIAISGKSITKGLMSAFFGLLLCTIGMDPACGYLRFVPKGVYGLYEGPPFIPTLIGLFALAEVFSTVEKMARGEIEDTQTNVKVTRALPSWADIKRTWKNILSGGLIGTFIGAIPGAGGDIGAFVSYGVSKGASRHPERFGTGIPEGVAATESANNGASGGAMIPLLSLGVPGGQRDGRAAGRVHHEGDHAGADDVRQRAAHGVRRFRRADDGQSRHAPRRRCGRAVFRQDHLRQQADSDARHPDHEPGGLLRHQPERVRYRRRAGVRADRVSDAEI